jgi:dCTP deaminase
MAVLTRPEIIRLIKEKKLKIHPFNLSQIGAGSIDLRLGNTFRVFRKFHGVFHINDYADYKGLTEVVKIKKGDNLLIEPGELVHGITVETIKLPKEISARIEGRSRFARLGLLTHISSGFVQPASDGKIVLEMANLSPVSLAIHPGTRICQIVLEEAKGEGAYKGKFSNQSRP